ncbi:MAG: winged helix-turn-helix transcriptional regulator [Actinomycetota bacterium]|nr:winged helix-turn-helix transcriptional regulator [Actinomycetota bacterium]
MRLEDAQTKDRIILFLKKSGGLTAEQLSKKIGITPMGIRQHLLALERKGIVNYEARKHGIGRPIFIYKLTVKADDLFPKRYHGFALDMLKDLESLDGRAKINELLRLRKERLLKEKSALLKGAGGLAGKLKALAGMLDEEGYIMDTREDGEGFVLTSYNCPLSKVAGSYGEVCQYEHELISELLGGNVSKLSSIQTGHDSCSFRVCGL